MDSATASQKISFFACAPSSMILLMNWLPSGRISYSAYVLGCANSPNSPDGKTCVQSRSPMAGSPYRRELLAKRRHGEPGKGPPMPGTAVIIPSGESLPLSTMTFAEPPTLEFLRLVVGGHIEWIPGFDTLARRHLRQHGDERNPFRHGHGDMSAASPSATRKASSIICRSTATRPCCGRWRCAARGRTIPAFSPIIWSAPSSCYSATTSSCRRCNRQRRWLACCWASRRIGWPRQETALAWFCVMGVWLGTPAAD